VRPVPVVSVQPDRQRSGAVVRGRVGLSVGPFAQRRLDEALGLAVGARRVGLGPNVLEATLILQAVSWSLRYPLSYRDIEQLFLERGLEVDHSTLFC
jgi:hypothetical protein